VIAPAKHYVYAVVDKVNDELKSVQLTRADAREWVTHLGTFGDGPETLRVRRAKLTLFES
jgi:hypothetical protein